MILYWGASEEPLVRGYRIQSCISKPGNCRHGRPRVRQWIENEGCVLTIFQIVRTIESCCICIAPFGICQYICTDLLCYSIILNILWVLTRQKRICEACISCVNMTAMQMYWRVLNRTIHIQQVSIILTVWNMLMGCQYICLIFLFMAVCHVMSSPAFYVYQCSPLRP